MGGSQEERDYFFDIPIRSQGILFGLSRGVRATDQVCHYREVAVEATEQIKAHRKMDKTKASGREENNWSMGRGLCHVLQSGETRDWKIPLELVFRVLLVSFNI